jgi:nucleoid-associated protein YgaU
VDDQNKSQVGAWALGALAAAVLGALVLILLPAPSPTLPVLSVAAPEATAPMPAPEPEPAPEPVVAAPVVPAFDTFRLDPDGSIIVAGRAAPEQVVDLILGGVAIARATADATGSFVMLAGAGPADQPRRLSLLADPDGAAVPSQTSYMVAPIAPVVVAEAAPEIAPETTPETTPETAPQIAPQTAAEAPIDPPTEEADLPETETAQIAPEPAPPPVVLETGADGVRVAQGAAVLPQPNVALDAITYDPAGAVELTGRATGDGEVQVYLDNESVAAAPVTAGGDWSIALPPVATGVYTLRIDEVDADGTVVSRMETPFQREEPASVAAVMAEDTARDGFEVAVRTVQPGSTLWAIAKESLGAGILYVQVFEANSDLIRDPDLIYPGQVFRIPDIAQ